MQLALASQALGPDVPLAEDIRVAAVTGYPWLVVDARKYRVYLDEPDFDIRDLKRLFLRTQPAALDGLHIPDCDPEHTPIVEGLCKEARRLGAPVVVAHVERLDERVSAFAEVAKRWSTVLALAAEREDQSGPTFDEVRGIVQRVNREALGWIVDTVALWRSGATLDVADAGRTILAFVEDRDEQGKTVLPGSGVLPLYDLLHPLYRGGFDNLAVFTSEADSPLEDVEAFARAGREALHSVVSSIGWTVTT